MQVTEKGLTEQILPGGEALVRGQNKNYLIANTLVGEKVEFVAVGQRRGVARGLLDKVCVASKDRITPICLAAADCGGCTFQYMHPITQAKVKSAWVEHAFKAVMHHQVDWQAIKPIPELGELDKRRRVRWHVQYAQEQLSIGFRKRASHQVQPNEQCMVITSELNQLRQSLQQFWQQLLQCQKMHEQHLAKSIYAVQTDDGIHIVLEFEQLQSDIEQWLPHIDEIVLPMQWWQHVSKPLPISKPITRPVCRIHDILHDGIKLQIGPDDFVQGQQAGNRQIIAQLQQWTGDACYIVDLFAGIGNLSLPLLIDQAKRRVVGAELSAASVRAANNNAKALKLNAEYVQANLFQHQTISAHLSQWAGADFMLLDPPRKGAKQVCQMMMQLLPQAVAMIHCDVAAAKRDAVLMQQAGYRLQALRALDLFPYSGHVESMSLWMKIDS